MAGNALKRWTTLLANFAWPEDGAGGRELAKGEAFLGPGKVFSSLQGGSETQKSGAEALGGGAREEDWLAEAKAARLSDLRRKVGPSRTKEDRTFTLVA